METPASQVGGERAEGSDIMKASGVMNGVRKHWTENGPVYQSNLESKLVECRKYAQHTGRTQELAKLERLYVKTFGLLKFVKLFDWFYESLNPNTETV